MSIIKATAQQLAWERARDKPSQQDEKDAEKMVANWNQSRIEKGLKPFDEISTEQVTA